MNASNRISRTQLPSIKNFLCILIFSLFTTWMNGQNLNTIQSITTADGLGNNGCNDVLLASNGDVWVTHQGYTPAVSYNHTRPISRRDAQGNWTYPDLSQAPAVTNLSFTYDGNEDYHFDRIYEDGNGRIWFLPYYSSVSNVNMGYAPPVIMFDGNNWNSFHSSAANFPNMGSVLDMVEDPAGNLWFGCAAGLVRMTPAGNFSTFNPPAVPYQNGQTRQADNIISLDINNAGNVVMVASQHNTATGGGFMGWACVRQFDPLNNQWSNWHLSDAPWADALRVYYQPRKLVAMRDASDRLYISTVGGGLYYIDNADFASNANTMIADYQGWSYGGHVFPNIFTNLPDFTYEVFRSATGDFWTTVVQTTHAANGAYKFEAIRPATYNGAPASYYAFAQRRSELSIVSAGQLYNAQILNMDFAANDAEIWFATTQGLERWYADYPAPATDFIGIEGAGLDYSGIVAFNTHSNNHFEPVGKGHELPVGTPTNSIDTAYYYLATSDYDDIDTTVEAGLQGDGFVQGFAQTAAALQATGHSWNDLQIRFTPISLGDDVRGDNDDWQYGGGLETRRYRKRVEDLNDSVSLVHSHYTLLLDGFPLFRGEMPLTRLNIRFNKYGPLFDSIGAITEFVRLDTLEWLDDLCDCLPNAAAETVARALAQDVGDYGVRFSFRSIQSANREDLNNAGRTGGFYSVRKGMLEKGTVLLPAQGPMGGIVRVGNSAQAEYNHLQAAVNALRSRGMERDVQFRIEPGVYEGIYDLDNIPLFNGLLFPKITFMSTTGDSSDVVVRKKPGRRDTNYVFRIGGDVAGVSWYKITVENTEDDDSSRVFLVTKALEHLNISHCVINGRIATQGQTQADLLFMTHRAKEMYVHNSRWEGGYRAFQVNALDEARITKNTFAEQQHYAFEVLSGEPLMVAGNLIHGPSTGTFNGVFINGLTKAMSFTNNRLINQEVPCGRALFVNWTSGPNSYNNGGMLFVNNEISVLGAASTEAVNMGGNFSQFLHNSISVSGSDTASLAMMSSYIFDEALMQGNIFHSENGRVLSYLDFNGDFGIDLSDNLYFTAHPTPFVADTGDGPHFYANLNALEASGRESGSYFINPMFLSADFLLPQNVAAKGLALNHNNAERDINGVNRGWQNRDHGCYAIDSTIVAPACNDFGLQVQAIGNYRIRAVWETQSPGAYQLQFRLAEDTAWSIVLAQDTFRVLDNRRPGNYEFRVLDLTSGSTSCAIPFEVSCANNISFEYNVFQAPEMGRRGRLTVLNLQGGKRKYNIALINSLGDTTLQANRRIGFFNQLDAGDYSIHVWDAFDCKADSVATFTIDALDTNHIPYLIGAPNSGPNGFRPIWNEVDGAINYQLRVVNVTDGVLHSFTPGIVDTSLIVNQLPVGKLYRFNVRARYLNGVTPVLSAYSNPVSRNLPLVGNKTASSGSDGGEELPGISVSVYPNPTSDILYVRTSEVAAAELVDINGRVLWKALIEGDERQINMETLATGVYFLRISTGREIRTERIIKE